MQEKDKMESAMHHEAEHVKTPTLTWGGEERKIDFSFMEPGLGKMNSSVSEEKTASAGSVEEDMLTEEEKKQVEEFVKKIDVKDVKLLNSYGAAAQKGISTFSTSLTGNVKTNEFGEVGDSLRELQIAINSTVGPEKKGFLGLFKKGKQQVKYIIAN